MSTREKFIFKKLKDAHAKQEAVIVPIPAPAEPPVVSLDNNWLRKKKAP